MIRDTRSSALTTLRDLIIVGNLMAQKIGEDPNNLANTWDEMVERVRASGILDILQAVALSDIVVTEADESYAKRLSVVTK